MPDTAGLKMIGFIFGGMTFAVALVATVIVHKVTLGDMVFEQTQPGLISLSSTPAKR